MSHFKQVWVSFFRQSRGFGMIEAAITLPLFLMITFGIIEFGNMFLQRYQTRDVANDVADYLQANPSASSADLQTFVTNLGFGSMQNMGSGEENNVFTKIKIKSEKTMMTAAQFDTLCSGENVKNYGNPWLLDGDVANDKNPYYIHICYPYTYNTITPLPNLTGGAIPETKTINSKALAYITSSTSSVGFYTINIQGTCLRINPKTGGCSCSSGTSTVLIAEWNSGAVAGDLRTNPDQYYCVGYTTPGNKCGYITYGCI